MALKRALRPGGVSTGLIKGESSREPGVGLVPGYSASGQDVWLPKATHFGPGLVLSAVGARCGKVFQADGAWSVVANTVVLTPQPGHDVRFLWYLTNNENFWEKGGTAQPYVRVPDTLAQKVWLPALKEQRAIADYLDTETARVDALIEKKQRMVAVLHERFGVALAGIFTAVDATRRKLAAVADVSLGRQRNPASDSGPDMVPYLRAANVKDGSLDLSDVKQMNFAPREQRIFALKPGDVLVTEGAGSLAAVGASAAFLGELQSPVCFQNTLIRLRARPGVRADYLAWWTRFAYRTGVLADLAGGANIFHIGAERMQTLALPLPSEGVQGEVVDRLSRVETSHLALVERLERQIDVLRERRQTLITAAVTGELEVPGVAA